MGRQGYSAEFRRKVLDLLAEGRSVASCRARPRHQRPDDLQLAPPGPDRPRTAAGAEHRRECRAREGQEADQRARDRAGHQPACDGAAEGGDQPKRRYAAIEVMAAENLPVQVACRVLGVSESGYYEHLKRAPSERSIRHAMLTDLISQIHVESHGIYGAPTHPRRAHAGPRRRGRPQPGRAADAPSWPAGPHRSAQVEADPCRRHRHRPRRARLHPCRTEPALGHRHHRTPDPRGQGLLLRHPRHLLPPGRGLVDRRITDRCAGHQRARDGHRQPARQACRGRERSSTPTTEFSSVPGPSPNAPKTPACWPRWAASATATTTP